MAILLNLVKVYEHVVDVANYWSMMPLLPFDHEEAGKLFLEYPVFKEPGSIL